MDRKSPESWLALIPKEPIHTCPRARGTELARPGSDYHGLPDHHIGCGVAIATPWREQGWDINDRDYYASRHCPVELMSGYK